MERQANEPSPGKDGCISANGNGSFSCLEASRAHTLPQEHRVLWDGGACIWKGTDVPCVCDTRPGSRVLGPGAGASLR